MPVKGGSAFVESKLMKTLAFFLEDSFSVFLKRGMLLLSPEGIMTKKRELDQKIQNNHDTISSLNKEIDELRNANADLAQKIDEYKETCSKLRENKAKMETQIQASMQQASLLRRNLVSEQNNLRTSEEELENENKKSEEMTEQIIEIQQELAELEYKGTKLANELKELDAKIAENNSIKTSLNDIIYFVQNILNILTDIRF